MKERPILFSAPMVRALLDGCKTQTRRVIARPLQHPGWTEYVYFGPSKNNPSCPSMAIECGPDYPDGADDKVLCPYGAVGDRLYVRETWSQPTTLDPGPTAFRADYPACLPGYTNLPPVDQITWKPSIHMPRALSRIMLEIVSVRVERLNGCSEADAEAEGCERLDSEREDRDWKLCPTCGGTRLHRALGPNGGVIEDVDCRDCDTYAKRYRHLWESINGAGSWDANPWVWVIEFRRIPS